MPNPELIDNAAAIVASYVRHNKVAANGLSSIIADVHRSLARLNRPEPAQPKEPAVPVEKSVHREYLICLEDGLKFRSMKRHLAQLGMTPEEYRAKWRLPWDYPMVAPAYAAKRSELAKAIGLGGQIRNSRPTEPVKRGRGRPKKTAALT